MRIRVNTYFDITETGVNRLYKGQTLPAKLGKTIVSTKEDWNIKRSQQNNFETVVQVLSMRGTPCNLSSTKKSNGVWSFTFEVDSEAVYGKDLELLKKELVGTPMITSLGEEHKTEQFLNNDNIWFEIDV